MKFQDTVVAKKMLSRITLKKIKTEIGHDLMGYYCDVYFDKNRVGYVNDDGCGGDVILEYKDKYIQKHIEQILKDNNVAQVLFETDYSFYDTVDKVGFQIQITCLVELKLNQIMSQKLINKRQKYTLSGIVFGTDDRYKAMRYKKPLSELMKIKGFKEKLQKEYDKIKNSLKDNEKIFNTNLEDFGIKL